MTVLDVDPGRHFVIPDTPHPNLAAALVAALADLSVVEKGRTANAGSYSYDYADLADVVQRTRPVLAEHGVVALTPVHEHGTGLACTVVLLHASGDRLDFGPFPFPHGKDALATGSMVTYHRRYALVAALGMAAGDDDDGAAAQPRQAPAPVEAAPEVVFASPDQIKALVEAAKDVRGEDGFPVVWNRPPEVEGDGPFLRVFDTTLVEVVGGRKQVAVTAETVAALLAELEVPSPLAEKVAALPVYDDTEPF